MADCVQQQQQSEDNVLSVFTPTGYFRDVEPDGDINMLPFLDSVDKILVILSKDPYYFISEVRRSIG